MAKIILVLIDAIAAIVATRMRRNWLQSFVVLNMLFIPIFGGRLIDVFGFVSNIGNIFFAFAILGFALILLRDGRPMAYFTLNRVFAVFVGFYLVSGLLAWMPVVPENELVVLAQARIWDFTSSVVIASFAAMLVSVSLLIWLLGFFRQRYPVLAYAVITPIVQTVDSLIFFPIAFYRADVDLVSLMLDGIVIKIGLALITVPIIALLLHDHHFFSHRIRHE